MNKIVMYHPCYYTRLALVELLGGLHSVFCTNNSEDLFYFLNKNKRSVNILILSSIHTELFLPKAQGKLFSIISNNTTNLKIFLSAERSSIKQFRFVLHSIKGCLDTVDLRMPLPDLITWFDRKVSDECCPVKSHHTGDTSVLNSREHQIIYLFLMGYKVERIASILALSKKSVSGYKCSGLSKLGVRNFQELLLPQSAFASPLSPIYP